MAMGTRRRRQRQEQLWISHNKLVNGPAHPFYKRVNELWETERFDEFAEKECARFYAKNNGRPSLTPGIYFRLLLVGYFEGIDAERGIAWRAADSIGLRKFLGMGLDEQTPDHSTISRTRRLIDVETHRKVFFWILELLRDRGLLKGKTVGIDATTLEAKRGDAFDRAARQWGELRGISERVGEGIGNRNADAGRSGAVGSHAEEQSQQQRLGESA
jgi:transposase